MRQHYQRLALRRNDELSNRGVVLLVKRPGIYYAEYTRASLKVWQKRSVVTNRLESNDAVGAKLSALLSKK